MALFAPMSSAVWVSRSGFRPVTMTSAPWSRGLEFDARTSADEHDGPSGQLSGSRNESPATAYADERPDIWAFIGRAGSGMSATAIVSSLTAVS